MTWAAAILLIAIALPVIGLVLPWLWWIAASPFLAAIWIWEQSRKKPTAGKRLYGTRDDAVRQTGQRQYRRDGPAAYASRTEWITGGQIKTG